MKAVNMKGRVRPVLDGHNISLAELKETPPDADDRSPETLLPIIPIVDSDDYNMAIMDDHHHKCQGEGWSRYHLLLFSGKRKGEAVIQMVATHPSLKGILRLACWMQKHGMEEELNAGNWKKIGYSFHILKKEAGGLFDHSKAKPGKKHE